MSHFAVLVGCSRGSRRKGERLPLKEAVTQKKVAWFRQHRGSYLISAVLDRWLRVVLGGVMVACV